MSYFTNRVKTVGLILPVVVVAALSVGAAVVPIYATSLPAAVKSALPGTLTLRDGKVTAQLNAASLEDVMAEVSRLSGVQVVWLDDTSRVRPVSVGFTNLPLLRALERLLGETNFVLFYTGDPRNTKLTHVWIAARRQRAEPLQTALVPASFLTGTTFTGDEPMDALIQTALYAPDPAARARIVAPLGLRDQEDDRVRSILSLMAFEDDDPNVRNVAAEMFYSLGNLGDEEDQKEVEEEEDELVEAQTVNQ